MTTSNHVYFSSASSAPFHLLSNFNEAPIRIMRNDIDGALLEACPELSKFIGAEGVVFRSSEHAWQALKTTDPTTFARFVEGDLASFGEQIFDVFFPGEGAKKLEHWSKKKNVGIVPKMAANKKYAKRLRFKFKHSMDYSREKLRPDLERRVWNKLLRLKFQQNEPHRRALLSTGMRKLVEFDRGAARNKGTHWGGLVDPDGNLHGENVMGRYLEEVRAELATEQK